MVVVQELSDHDLVNRNTVAERLIGSLSDDAIILMTDEGYFHGSGNFNRAFAIGQRRIHSSFINGHFTVYV
jgi:hypothetical protein